MTSETLTFRQELEFVLNIRVYLRQVKQTVDRIRGKRVRICVAGAIAIKVTVADPAQNKLHLILPRSPILASDGSNWKNIHFAYFQQPPCNVPEHVSPRHTLCINVGKPVRLEQAVDGQRKAVDSILGDAGNLSRLSQPAVSVGQRG